jgi:hypothetical protein
MDELISTRQIENRDNSSMNHFIAQSRRLFIFSNKFGMLRLSPSIVAINSKSD